MFTRCFSRLERSREVLSYAEGRRGFVSGMKFKLSPSHYRLAWRNDRLESSDITADFRSHTISEGVILSKAVVHDLSP